MTETGRCNKTPIEPTTLSAHHMAAIQCMKASRRGEDDLIEFKPSIIRMERKRDFSDVGSGMVVGVRRAGPSISKTLLAFSSSKGKVGVRPATSEVNLKYLKWSVYAFLKSFRIKFSHDEKKKA